MYILRVVTRNYLWYCKCTVLIRRPVLYHPVICFFGNGRWNRYHIDTYSIDEFIIIVIIVDFVIILCILYTSILCFLSTCIQYSTTVESWWKYLYRRWRDSFVKVKGQCGNKKEEVWRVWVFFFFRVLNTDESCLHFGIFVLSILWSFYLMEKCLRFLLSIPHHYWYFQSFFF